ncbi:MAG: lysylphosphatidylglycerol synthase transmembrane domain-containing protein [Candidatus Omnitrophica bacterium]|nr:lysylphosphatidylglycerol synthase transmembrane domain-containing protein [Candidatus Omnitrophota bacterium]
MKKILRSAVFKVIISLSLIMILLYLMRGKYGEIAAALKNTNIRIFALGFTIFLITIGVASYRFLLIIRAQGVTNINFKDAASLSFIGLFFNNFLPTSIGGDLVKAYCLSHKTRDRIGSFASVLVDRLIGLLTMIFMASVALLFIQSSIISDDIRQVLYGITALALILVLLIINKTFAKKVSGILAFARPMAIKFKEAYYTIHHYKHNKRLIAKSLAISVMSQLLSYLSFGTIAFSMGARISPIDAFLRIPLVSLMSMLPSLNGLGLREGATVVLFGPLIGKESAFAVSILWILVLLMSSIIGGLIYALSPQFRVKFNDLKKEAAR